MKFINVLAMILFGMIALAESRRRRRRTEGDDCGESLNQWCVGDQHCCDSDGDATGKCQEGECAVGVTELKAPAAPATERRRRRRY